MLKRWLLILFVVAIPAHSWAVMKAEDKSQLEAAMAGVDTAETQLNDQDRNIRPEVQKSLETLDRLIQSNRLDDASLLDAVLYRANAIRLLNHSRKRDGLPIDTAAAQRAVDDFNVLLKVAEANGIKSGWVANIEYTAGSVAFNHLRDEALAFTYWRSCSEKQHAGCMNVVAHSALVGSDGQAVDHRLAIDLHKKISNTGTRFTCAGAFSSLSVFDMMYFLDLTQSDDRLGVWLDRSLELVNQIAEQRNGADPCGRAMFEISNYIYKLSQGDKQEAILRGILRSKQSPDARTIAQFMLGQTNAAAVMSAIRGSPDAASRCITHFVMMWHGQVSGNQTVADAHYESMKQAGGCEAQMVYARKYYP